MCILPGLFLFSGSVMSDSLRPHGLQPGRLLRPWNSPSKNTGLGCHALLRGDLPNPGIKPASLTSPALAGEFFTTGATWEAHTHTHIYLHVVSVCMHAVYSKLFYFSFNYTSTVKK